METKMNNLHPDTAIPADDARPERAAPRTADSSKAGSNCPVVENLPIT